jgi:CBS-domain-containing membrane protein
MQIGKLMRADVFTCRAADTADAAAKVMWDRDVGCVPVIDDTGHVAGVVTDRDLCMAAYTRGVPLSAIPVSTVMSGTVYSCGPEDDVAAVERTMAMHQIRRMPVIDEHGVPVGMISLNDLARAASVGPNSVSSAGVAKTLAAVGAPRPAIIAPS